MQLGIETDFCSDGREWHQSLWGWTGTCCYDATPSEIFTTLYNCVMYVSYYALDRRLRPPRCCRPGSHFKRPKSSPGRPLGQSSRIPYFWGTRISFKKGVYHWPKEASCRKNPSSFRPAVCKRHTQGHSIYCAYSRAEKKSTFHCIVVFWSTAVRRRIKAAVTSEFLWPHYLINNH